MSAFGEMPRRRRRSGPRAEQALDAMAQAVAAAAWTLSACSQGRYAEAEPLYQRGNCQPQPLQSCRVSPRARCMSIACSCRERAAMESPAKSRAEARALMQPAKVLVGPD